MSPQFWMRQVESKQSSRNRSHSRLRLQEVIVARNGVRALPALRRCVWGHQQLDSVLSDFAAANRSVGDLTRGSTAAGSSPLQWGQTQSGPEIKFRGEILIYRRLREKE
jgi:hypothetical protein